MHSTEVPAQLRDFRNFLFLCWQHLRLPVPTDVQYDIADFLQSDIRRLVIEAFRGVGKSWITSAFVCWCLLIDPQCEILVISASKQRADEFSTFTLRLIQELPILAHLRPDPNTQRMSRVAFDVAPHQASHSPSVKSIGINGQIAGSRANIVILDDVEIPNNSATQMMRDKLSEQIKEADAVVKPGGRIIYLGTPQTYESIYNRLEERGYEIRVWPAQVPDEKRLKSYGSRLAKHVTKMIGVKPVGTSTDPKRFTDADLAERRASYGNSGFALQFMLDTTLSDANRYPLKQADLVVMALDLEQGPLAVVWGSGPTLALKDIPNLGFTGDFLHGPMAFGESGENGMKFSSYTSAAMFIDPAGRGADDTAYAIVKELHGQLFAAEARGLDGGYDDATLEKLANAAIRHRVNTILIEKNFGDGMFTQLLRPVLLRKGWAGAIEEIHSTGQKELRVIDTLEPLMNRHKLVIDKRLAEDDFQSTREREGVKGETSIQYSLFYQLTHITRDRGSLRHDDLVEALAGACRFFVDRVNRDQDKAMAQHIDALRDKEIAEFVKKAKHWHVTMPPRGSRKPTNALRLPGRR
ncbi:hypothetical protein UFOVP823_20 [uncultured Caudovirales phage]|uniref:Terminase, large subunit n=1 Tax=uncultured Caudovirales phage TaxID=2100421 RepID=A0A6J5P5K0_9CAUD|nr:hypothetical protein UFOVP823_20 [uncultured Caudovirales phage]